MNNQKWYKANAGNDQGLIVSENDGRNIAVSYDIKDADLIASAPELLEACKNLLTYLETRDIKKVNMNLARAAISKAEGN